MTKKNKKKKTSKLYLQNSTSDLPERGIGFFTLIEPLITPIQLLLEK